MSGYGQNGLTPQSQAIQANTWSKAPLLASQGPTPKTVPLSRRDSRPSSFPAYREASRRLRRPVKIYRPARHANVTVRRQEPFSRN